MKYLKTIILVLLCNSFLHSEIIVKKIILEKTSESSFVPPTQKVSNDIRDYFPSIVRIIAHKDFGEDIGTGIIIGTKGQEAFILTALHVVSESTKKEVLIYKQKTTSTAEVILENKSLDLAILKIKNKVISKNKTFYPAYSKRFQNELSVKSIGHPAGSFWKLNSLNKIQETELYEEERKFSISPQSIAGGCSGGPVFLENGAWLGLITETNMVDGKCVKAGVIQQWLRKNNIPSQNIYYPDMKMISVKGKQKKTIPNRPDITGDLEVYSRFRDSDEQFSAKKVEDFLLGEHELTVADFEGFVIATNYQTDCEKDRGAIILKEEDVYEGKIIYEMVKVTGINWRHDEFGKKIKDEDKKKRPVIFVSPNDAISYCNWLNEVSGNRYRLPTHEELLYVTLPKKMKNKEYALQENVYDLSACQIEITTYRSFPCSYWREESKPYNDGFPTLAPIQQYKCNFFGFYDLYGNVSEWCTGLDYDNDKYISFFGANWCTSTWEKIVETQSDGRTYTEIWDTLYSEKEKKSIQKNLGKFLLVTLLIDDNFLPIVEINKNIEKGSSNFIGIRLARSK